MFYERIKKIAKDNGKPITAILKELEIPTSYTGFWKKGKMPNAEILIKLSNYFNVSVDYMLELTDNPNINK
mgnify:CR=1 FL=1